jgi:hypothetical protein
MSTIRDCAHSFSEHYENAIGSKLRQPQGGIQRNTIQQVIERMILVVTL